MSDKEPTPFDIHLSSLRGVLTAKLRGGSKVSLEDIRDIANESFDNIYGSNNDSFLNEIFNWYVSQNIFVSIGNKYSESIFVYDAVKDKNVGFASIFKGQFGQILNATNGDYAKKWRLEALTNSLNDIEFVNERAHDENNDHETWRPLPIEREEPEYLEALKAVEDAIRVIESDNGYSANEPEERDAILTSLQGGTEALKNGAPTLKYLKDTLESGFRYLAKKFTDSAIGVAAKKAFEALLLFIGL